MEKLCKAFEQLNIKVSGETIEKFQKHMELVLAWNEKVNLTAITDKNGFIEKHFIDSVLCAGFCEFQNADMIIDVGTGAGFPGIPLAMVFPEKNFLLIDSLAKKIKILAEIAETLELSNVKLLHTRAEDLARKAEYREKYDICVSRAVANMAVLSEYCLPFIKVGGSLIAYRGPDAEKELAEAKGALEILGGGFAETRKVDIDGFDLDHNMIVIEKKNGTPAKFPRKAGTPLKNPLK